MNTNLFSRKARGKNIDAAALQQMNWLRQQLLMAKNNQEKVFIAMHIPMSVDVYLNKNIKLLTLFYLWKPIYVQAFEEALENFSPQIKAVFAGHLHTNWYQFFATKQDAIPFTGTVSVSPIFGNNPGFKIYSFDTATNQLAVKFTYEYPFSKRKWDFESAFSKIHNPYAFNQNN